MPAVYYPLSLALYVAGTCPSGSSDDELKMSGLSLRYSFHRLARSRTAPTSTPMDTATGMASVTTRAKNKATVAPPNTEFTTMIMLAIVNSIDRLR